MPNQTKKNTRNKKKSERDNLKNYKIAQQSTYQPMGMSSKDKSIVIMSCQKCTSRYKALKALSENAIKNRKIFTINGNCNAIRGALVERGWVEKLPTNKMNLHKVRFGLISSKPEVIKEMERLYLSHMVEKYATNFIWFTGDDHINASRASNEDIIVNKLKVDAVWTTKQGLCDSMKSNYWFYIEDVADVHSPRSYNSYDRGETEDFIKDYRITTCTSLLKWVLTMVVTDRPVFVTHGKVPMNVILFALNACKDFLLEKQNRDIDRSLGTVTTGHWNAFLKTFYRIISREDCFEPDTENHLPLYLACAKLILKEMHRYRPQLSCEGCHNIWIIKPAHCSRGRGIRMASKLAVISEMLLKTAGKYVIQKYIEEPLLIHDTKFDFRQYYLVTSTYPLVIWMYKDCYLKFSSQKYNLKNYHESIHLTNNAVQKKYKNCLGRDPDLPQDNMWSLEQFREHLNRIGKERVWDGLIYPGMKKSIVGIMLCCQDSLSVSKKRFELYGCDFILDKEYKPWLIEINSCPDLNSTTSVTEKICPAVLADLIKVVIDYAKDQRAATGNFECIYRQPLTMPCYGFTDMTIKGFSLPNEYFYRKSLECTELVDPTIFKDVDVKEMLDKLKRYFEPHIMLGSDLSQTQSSNTTDSGKSLKVTEPSTSWSDSDIGNEDTNFDGSSILNYDATFESSEEENKSPKAPLSTNYTESSVRSITDIKGLFVKAFQEHHPLKGEKLHSTDINFNNALDITKYATQDKDDTIKSENNMKSERDQSNKNKIIFEDPSERIQIAACNIIEFIKNKQEEHYR